MAFVVGVFVWVAWVDALAMKEGKERRRGGGGRPVSWMLLGRASSTLSGRVAWTFGGRLEVVAGSMAWDWFEVLVVVDMVVQL